MRIQVPSINLNLPLSLITIATLVLSYFAFRTANPATKGILEGLAGCGYFAVLTWLAATAHTNLECRRFRRFFGKSAFENKMYLIYPHFTLASEVDIVLKKANVHPQRMYVKESVFFQELHWIDIPEIVAMNDIQALLHVAVMFGDFVQKTPPIRPDSEAMHNSTDSFISFGFSSNECTHMYLKTNSHPLFKKLPDDPGSRYAEYIEVHPEGTEPLAYRSTPSDEIGIIVRHRPSLDTALDVVWFICGGLGPKGTIGAGYYLAEHWRDFWNEVGDKDFLCVLSVATWDYKRTTRLLLFSDNKILYQRVSRTKE